MHSPVTEELNQKSAYKTEKLKCLEVKQPLINSPWTKKKSQEIIDNEF